MKRFARKKILLLILLLIPVISYGFEYQDAIGVISFPSPEFIAKDVQPIDKWQSPLVTKEFRFEFGDSAGVIVSTRIRAGLPADERVLDRVEPELQNAKKHFGAEWIENRRFLDGDFTILESATFNNDYTEQFPFGVGPDRSLAAIEKIAISQFMVVNARLIEIAIHVPAKTNESREALLNRARSLCTSWRNNVKTAPPAKWEPDLPAPQKGYSWVECAETKNAFLMPMGWHFKKVLRDDIWGYFISKEDIDERGSFLTGLSVNVVTGVPSKAGVPPSVYAKAFIREGTESKEVLKDPWESAMGPFVSYGVQLKTKDDLNGDFVTHHLAIANDTTGTLYIVSFESPLDEWDSSWLIAEPILNRLFLDSDI